MPAHDRRPWLNKRTCHVLLKAISNALYISIWLWYYEGHTFIIHLYKSTELPAVMHCDHVARAWRDIYVCVQCMLAICCNILLDKFIIIIYQFRDIFTQPPPSSSRRCRSACSPIAHQKFSFVDDPRACGQRWNQIDVGARRPTHGHASSISQEHIFRMGRDA